MAEGPLERRSSDSEVLALRTEVTALREATSDMTDQVGQLAGALTTVSELQEHQLETERIVRTAATRVEQVDAASHRRAFRLTTVVVTMIIVGLVFVIGATIATVAYVHAQSDSRARYRQLQYSGCIQRNEQLTTAQAQAQAGQVLITKWIQLEEKAADQATAQALIALLKQAESQPPPASAKPVDCSLLLTQ